MVKIAFWDNGLGIRGTSVALYDYAHYNENILKNDSIILYNKLNDSNDTHVVKKFSDRFYVYGVNHWNEVDDILLKHQCDILYVIKSGDSDQYGYQVGNKVGQVSKIRKTVVHCVFNCNRPHGDVYASISPFIENAKGFPTVPHMINLPDLQSDLREKLNIPSNSIVFGRHGGYEQFDIKYVQTTVFKVAKENPNIYFLFVNTKPFCESLPNIIHHDKIVDLDEKTEYINTCDAMLWARGDGETFGLSIGEFSMKNKPVFVTETGQLAHKFILKNKAIWYSENTLYDLLTSFDKTKMLQMDWQAYGEFTPEKVMEQFDKIFIQKNNQFLK
jgi:hypothetical protein